MSFFGEPSSPISLSFLLLLFVVFPADTDAVDDGAILLLPEGSGLCGGDEMDGFAITTLSPIFDGT